MFYQLNEGTLDVPEGLVDRSINMLMVPGGGPGFSVIVGRDRLESGESLDQFINRQLKDLIRQVSKFKEGERKPAAVAAKTSPLSAQLLDFNYRQNGQPVYQRQCVILLADQTSVVILTASTATPFDDAMTKSWNQVIASFKPKV